MQSPIVSNTRNQGDRQRTQSGSVPFPGSSMRGNAYGTQRHSDSMATFSTHSSAQVGASDNAQILSGDFMDDGDGGAPNNNSQAQLTEKPNYLNEFWAALQKMQRERPKDITQVEGGALWIPNHGNFFTNILPDYFRKLPIDTFRKYMGELGYGKKRAKKNENSSLWVPNKAPRHSHPASQQTEPTTAVPIAGIMALSPSAQPDPNTRVNELQNQLDQLQNQLNEPQNQLNQLQNQVHQLQNQLNERQNQVHQLQNQLNERQNQANQLQSQLNELKERLVQQHGRATAEPICANCGSSQPVARNTPQTNHGDIHGSIPNGSPLKPKTGAYNVDTPQGVLGTMPSYNQVDPTLAHPQPYGDGFDATPGIGESYSGEHMPPGGTTAQVFAMQDSDFSTMSQGAVTTSGHHQGSTFAAGAGDSSQCYFIFSAPPPSSQAPNRTPPGYHHGSVAWQRGSMAVSSVPPMADPNAPYQSLQAYSARHRYRT